MAASTLLRLLKPHLLSLPEHLGGITQIFPHRDVDMWGRLESLESKTQLTRSNTTFVGHLRISVRGLASFFFEASAIKRTVHFYLKSQHTASFTNTNYFLLMTTAINRCSKMVICQKKKTKTQILKVLAHWVRNIRMRFFFLSYPSSFPIKMLVTDVKTQKIKPDLNFFLRQTKISEAEYKCN